MQSSPNWTVSTVLHTTTINFSPSDQYSLPELIDSDILGPDDRFEYSIFQNNIVDVGFWISVKYKKWWFSLEPPRKTAETIFQHSLLCWESSSEGTIQLTSKLKQVRHEKFRLLQYKLCESTYTFLSTVKCRVSTPIPYCSDWLQSTGIQSAAIGKITAQDPYWNCWDNEKSVQNAVTLSLSAILDKVHNNWRSLAIHVSTVLESGIHKLSHWSRIHLWVGPALTLPPRCQLRGGKWCL